MSDDIDIDGLIKKWLQAGKPVKDGAPLPFGKGNDWDVKHLHVTDLGACLRAVVLRVVFAAKSKPNTPAQDAMFDLANYAHWRVCRALDYADILLEEEVPLDMPGEWGGRLDYVRLTEDGGERIGDVKTVHPGWIRKTNVSTDERVGDYPKDEHVMQVSTYYHFHPAGDGECEILYLDRGGSNPSLPCPVRPYDKQTVLDRMRTVEVAVEQAREDKTLPPILEPHIKWGRRSKYGGVVEMDCWQCRYCRIYDCPAEREWPRELATVTKQRGVELTVIGRSHEDEVTEFIERSAEGARV